MEHGRGSSILREKGVTQDRNVWIPSTPDKPVLQSSNNDRSKIHHNQIGGENWHDLIDMYEDVLRTKQPHTFDLNSSEGLIYTEHDHEVVPPAENYSMLQQSLTPNGIVDLNRKLQNSQDVDPFEVYSSLPLNLNPNGCTGGNNFGHSIQNVSRLQRLRSLNENAGIGSYLQSVGEVLPHQEVNSFSELLNIMNSRRSSPSNESPDRRTFFTAKPMITCPVSQVESNQVAYASVGERVQKDHVLCGSNLVAYATVGAGFPQSHVLHENHDGGGYSQQEILNSRPSMGQYTLNFTPSEARESSSASRSLPLGPVTPDQQKQSSMTHRNSQVPHLLIDGTSTPEKYMHGRVVTSESEVLEKGHGDILENSKSATSFSSSQEIRPSDGANGGIDPMKTPQQKTPKRTKHRPKVVVEGKPKRSPKPASTKSNTPDGNLPAKRKYTRKESAKNSTPPTTGTVKVVEASDMGLAAKSCKRKLNFGMETGVEKRAEKEGQVSLPDHQEQNHEHQKLSLDSSGLSTTAAKAGHKTTYDKEIRQMPTACNFVHSMNNMPPQELMLLETTALMPSPRDHNLNAIARSFNMQNASTQQSNGKSGYNQVLHRSSGGFPHLVFQGNPCEQNLGSEAHSSVWSKPQVLEGLRAVTDKQGTKREYKNAMLGSQQNVEQTSFQLKSCGVPEWKTGSETCKKHNIEDKFDGTSFNMYSGLTTTQEFIRQIQSRRSKSVLAQSSTELQMGESRESDCRRQMINIYPNNNYTNVMYDQYKNNPDIRHKFQQQHASSQVHLYSGRMLAKTYHNSADTPITKSFSAVINRNMESAPNRDPQPIAINGNANFHHHVVVNKQTSGNTSKKVAGISVEKRNIVSVDDITNCMKDLHITRSGKKLVRKEHGALVPYRGDGAVVPFEEFDIVTKKKPRPRVDLDPETNRLWNLLMGKEGGGGAETMDTHREKWWEEERKIFRGRVDSFIARMHLVQGDRRFSKWKGSVVDSVIGVFLTQNVSDHLSSSAFMSLAAKFPPKSTTTIKAHCENGGSPTVGNHDIRITYPDGTTSYQKMVMEPFSGHSSVKSTEKSQNRIYNVMPEEKTFDHTRRTAKDMISSQSPSESSVIQASEDVRSSSGSNSESECWWNISKNVGHVSVPKQNERTSALQQNEFQLKESSYPNNTHLIHHQQFEKPAYMQSSGLAGISKVHHHQSSVRPLTNSWLNMSLGMQNWESDAVSLLERETLSTLTSKDSKGTGAQCMDGYRGQNAESAFRMSEYGRAKSQTPSNNFAVPKEGLELKNDSLDDSCKTNSQHSVKHMSENQGALHQVMILKELRRPSEPFSKEPNDYRKHTEVETEVEQGQSSTKLSSNVAMTSNARKRRKDEKFNWDTLRKQVQLKAGIKYRSREAMDSLDYEALQNADVHVVSDTIKERGMNNILAGRMKNFLNRLVEDHERIDLEWLRDVDPDKAKDYLLSIQGLGLKSVECVRLLTLHHLAFPVDTNVGRIAVRLGWVPLQTLPESLQLHLLELYPVLESIQKYLWPRLCKLDQETLYELHYQMITFGKVFCTKRDPNCNACPMRAECRHFASAFASARLALPGPQARHIVSSAAPFRANNRSDVIVKPMALPPPVDTIEQGVRLAKDCEPVIEEPTTPEPPAEVEDRDIEDAFYEDPDEIPVIKLNIEEFTANLQSIIQEQVEIGEGDVSKALVALNSGLASIPTPKLKYVSRLRTEHQVYELLDSHILLKGMDRREPDDPSPYLLAIWTPGETADSVQAPESKCSSMEGGGLCNKTTCFSCNSTREAQAQTVRGTILVPCRTAMRGSFPLNGTYFQVNEVFADHESSLNPIDVPRSFLWNLPRRTVFFGSSVSSIFKGLTTEDIQFCFWKGFVCVRGFDQKTRAPRPLKARLHFPASKMAKRNEET